MKEQLTYTQTRVEYRIKIDYIRHGAIVKCVTIWHEGMRLRKMLDLLRGVKRDYQPRRIVLINEADKAVSTKTYTEVTG